MILNYKKILITFVALLIAVSIALIGYMAIMNKSFENWNEGKIKEGTETIQTDLGDQLEFKYVTSNFPDYQTEVSIMEKGKNVVLSSYHIESDYSKPEIKEYNYPELRCYVVNKCILLYKKDGLDFISINLLQQTSSSDIIYNQKIRDFVGIAKILVSKKEWQLTKYCASLLLVSGDADIKKTLERYSNNDFTQEELDINKIGGITRESMVIFAKQTLSQSVQK